MRQLQDFSTAFRVAADALRQGLKARFREGSFPPALPYAAESAVPDGYALVGLAVS